jgi:hypothetical protein
MAMSEVATQATLGLPSRPSRSDQAGGTSESVDGTPKHVSSTMARALSSPGSSRRWLARAAAIGVCSR